MTDEVKFRSYPPALPGQLQELVHQAGQLKDWSDPQRERGWQRLSRGVNPSRPSRAPSRRYVLAGVFAVLAVAILSVGASLLPNASPPVAAQSKSGSRGVELGDDGRLEVAADARLEVSPSANSAGERIVKLEAGWLRATISRQQPGQTVVIDTPHLRVTVIGTRFSVEVGPGSTSVRVEEGKVRVHGHHGGERLLGASEQLSSSELEPRTSAPKALPAIAPEEAPVVESAPSPIRSSECAKDAAQDRVGCLERSARGEGLAAQTALYELGWLARAAHNPALAVGHWQRYLERFPEGVFAPEALADSVAGLHQLGREEDAARSAERFRSRFPADSRRSTVARIRADALCALRTRKTEAHEAYLDAQTAPSLPGAHEEALYARAVCEAASGDSAAALSAFGQYLDRYPSGPRAAQIRSITSNR